MQTKKVVLIGSATVVALVALYLLGFLICFRWSGSRESFPPEARVSFSFARDGAGYYFRKLEGRHRSWFEDAGWHRYDDVLQAVYRPLINRLWTYDSVATTTEEDIGAARILGRFEHPGAYGFVTIITGETCFLVTIDRLFARWQPAHSKAMR